MYNSLLISTFFFFFLHVLARLFVFSHTFFLGHFFFDDPFIWNICVWLSLTI